MQNFPLFELFPYLIYLAISIVVAAYCGQHPAVRGSREFAGVATSRTVMILVRILIMISTAIEAKIIWNEILIVVTVVSNVTNLLFAVRYTDTRLPRSRLIFAVLYFFPMLYAASLFVDPSVDVQQVWLTPDSRLAGLWFAFTDVTLVISIYLYVLLFITCGLLFLYLLRSQPAYRLQISLVLGCFILQLIGGSLNLMRVTVPILGNTSAVGLTLGNLLVMWGLFRHRLFDLMPIARDMLIESMDDFVIVTNSDNRVIDLNASVVEFIGKPAGVLLGLPLNEIFSNYPEMVEPFTEVNDLSTEIKIKQAGKVIWYHLKIKPLHDMQKRLTGRLLVWRDITPLKQAQHKLLRQRRQLKKTVNIRTAALRQKVSDLEEAQQALRQSEERFRLILENMPILLDAFDEEGKIIVWNKACEVVTGYAAEDVIGNPQAMEWFYPDPEYRANVWAKASNLNETNLTFNLVCKNGEVRTIAWFDTYRHLTIPGWSVWGLGMDVTERVRAEEAEREQRAFAEALVDTAALLNQALDLDKVLDNVLENLERAVKYTSANIMLVEGAVARIVRLHGNRDPSIPLEYHIKELPLMQALVERIEPVCVQDALNHPKWVRRSEQIRSMIGVPISHSGKLLGIINVESSTPNFFRDDDVRRLQAFADQVSVAIHNARLYEEERRERILSQMFQRISDVSSHESNPSQTLKPVISSLAELIPQHNATILLIQEDALEMVASHGPTAQTSHTVSFRNSPFLQKVLFRGEPIFVSRQEQHEDWSQLPGVDPDNDAIAAWAAVPLVVWNMTIGLLCVTITDPHISHEQVIGSLLAFTQRTQLAFQNSHLLAELLNSKGDLQEARSHLLRSAELAIAGEIATGVAHQISNPLTAVMAHAYLLLKKIPSDDPLHQYAQAIQEATNRAGEVVQRMLDFARVKEPAVEPIDLNQSLQSAIALVRPQVQPTVRLSVDLASGIPPIMGSAEHLEDVWINLMVNAVDALKEQPDATIEIKSSYNPEQHMVFVRVKDNGTGIPVDLQNRIFSSFFTTKEHGVGLGLAICYDIVTNHHGTIHAESHEGDGTTFVIALPVSADSI